MSFLYDAPLAVPSAIQGAFRFVDPMASSDPSNGDMWLGGLAGGNPYLGEINGIFAVRKRAGQSAFDPPEVVTSNAPVLGPFDEKPLMAAGPNPLNPALINIYVAFQRLGDSHPQPVFCAFWHLMLSRWDESQSRWLEPTSIGPVNTPCDYRGAIATPAVVSNGRLFVAWGWADTGYKFTFSDNAGASWSPQANLFEGISVGQAIDFPGPASLGFLPGIAVDQRNAADPNDDHVYLVISARRAPGSGNLDLWVQRIRNVGTLGMPNPVQVDPPRRLDLDNPVDIAYAPDQVMPWVAVDAWGGVNLLYYDTRHHIVPDSHSEAFMDAYYARITDFMGPNEALERHRLSGSTFSSDTEIPYELQSSDPERYTQWLGDYQTIDAHECLVVPCYMSTETGVRHYYVHRIHVCPGDADGDGALTMLDVSLFHARFMAADHRADVTLDGQIGAMDVGVFYQTHAVGCR